MKKSAFLKNTLILTVTSLLLRTIGIFFRVYLSNRIGAQGMGLYQLIFSIYVLGATFASSGITTAVTRMTADALAFGDSLSARRVLRCAVLLALGIGVFSTALIFGGAGIIGTYWIQDTRAVLALQILSFSLPSMGISACIKGYFIARRNVALPSCAQLAEQAVRIAVIMLLIDRFCPYGIAYSCAAILIGDTIAEWTSCLFMAIGYAIDKKKIRKLALTGTYPSNGLWKKLLSIFLPITAGRYLNTLLRTVENTLVPGQLSRYTGSKETGLSQFGVLKGMALPFIFFPASFLSAISTLLVPEISSAFALKRQRVIDDAVRRTMRLTLLSSILISGFFLLYSDICGTVLYHSREVGLYMKVLAPLTPIMYLESVVDGILKGLNQQVSSLRYSLWDSGIRIVLILLLVPRTGMKGFLFIMVISNLLTCYLNVHRLLKVTGVRFAWWSWVIKPLIAVITAGTVTVVGTVILTPHLPLWAVTIGGVLVLCGLYAGLLGLFGCISRKDFERITVR